jgi:thymidine kinase
MGRGKLIFKYGCMGSGKSLQLLATANNFSEHNIPFLIFKSNIDTRDGGDVVRSRDGKQRKCIEITPTDNLFTLISDIYNTSYEVVNGIDKLKWILVDEAQFLTENQIDELAAIADMFNINILCYGLRTDFTTHLFPASKRLFEIADSFDEIKSSCFCGSKTIFNARINEDMELELDGEQIEPGDKGRYVSLCRKCFFQKAKNKYYMQ